MNRSTVVPRGDGDGPQRTTKGWPSLAASTLDQLPDLTQLIPDEIIVGCRS